MFDKLVSNVCFKKILTNPSSDTVMWIVQTFLKQRRYLLLPIENFSDNSCLLTEFIENFDQKIRWPWDSYWILQESIWWNTVLVSRYHQILQDMSENLLTSEFSESFDQNLRWPIGKPIFRFEISGCSTLVQTHQITWGKEPSNCTRTFSNST